MKSPHRTPLFQDRPGSINLRRDTVMVHAVHTKIAGRGRFHVEGLKGSPALKEWIEDHLVNRYGMFRASGSTITGNILILFKAEQDHETVACLIQNIIDALPDETPGSSRSPSNPRRAANEIPSMEKAPFRGAEALVALKDKVRQIISPLRPQPAETWHTLTAEEVLTLVDTDVNLGISGREVQHRLGQYGPNMLPESKPRSTWEIVSQASSHPFQRPC